MKYKSKKFFTTIKNIISFPVFWISIAIFVFAIISLFVSITYEKTGKESVKVDRKREYLSLYLWQAPRTPLERQQNKETLELAKKIRFERGQELLESAEGYRLKKNRDINFLDYFKSYIDAYTKKDIRMLQMALNRFVDFLNETPEYTKYSKCIKPGQITKDMIEAYTEYLQSRSIGEGAKSIYSRFKKVIVFTTYYYSIFYK